MLSSAAAPERVLRLLASMEPVVLASRLLRTDASREVSVRVMSSSLRPEMPLEE